MMQKIKKVIQIACIIFTALVVLQLLIEDTVNTAILYQLLAVSVLSAGVKFVLFRSPLFSYSWKYQLLYLFTIWVMILGMNGLFKWNMNKIHYISTGVTVLIVYVFVRLITYSHDRKEANEMNMYLNKRRELAKKEHHSI